jgi:hypothetical protein
MDPVCLLIEAVAVELCCLYIVNKWLQVTGGSRAKAEVSPKRAKGAERLVTLTVRAPIAYTPNAAPSTTRQAVN